MNLIPRLHGTSGVSFGRLLATSLSVWVLGVALSPALAATAQSPVVDQAPLIVQKSLPPNIVLMLDDSGSMASDYMPDWGYLKNNSNNDAVIDAKNNGVYYDPTIVYTPPLKADGTRYPDATSLTSAWVDGFDHSKGSKNLTIYKSSKITYSYVGSRKSTPTDSITHAACDDLYAKQSYAYKESWAADSWGADKGACTIYYHTFAYFQYSTGPAAGTYTVHYVADSDCGTQSGCVLSSDTSGVAAPNKDAAGNALLAQDGTALTAGQNIANWFAYYHTRLLMAKSGVMNAFSGVDATFRIGFGSIDGSVQGTCTDKFNNTYTCGGNENSANLPADRYSYKDSYNDNQTNYIAQVKTFGLGTDATSQKSALWSWISAAKASGGTPLRQALDAVGGYYETDQPWQSVNATSGQNEELACRQSYTILTTDGFWNGNTPSDLGNVDDTTLDTVTGPSPTKPYTYKPAAPFSDDNSDTLADVAMKYWAKDLRPAKNEVPVSKDDPAFWQHMTTFTLGLGFTPQGISPDTATIDAITNWAWNNGASISGFAWPAPSSNSINNIADLAHAGINGRGGFFSATSPQAFADGLKQALKRAQDRKGTGSSLAANSTQLKSGAYAYQALYYTGTWKGDLLAVQVDPNTGALAANATWSATDKLPVYTSRKIYTYNPDVSPVAAVAFDATTGLSSAELSALGSNTAQQTDMINYLRGDQSKEGKGVFRTRDTPLGDIVDSQPVYVGQPDANQFNGQTFTGSDKFAAYAAKARTGLLFVAANDGMLHAFNATSGVETFAYLPAAVITSGLKALADPDYGTTTAVPHQYFNDGELTVADVYFGSAWHTVAVGTTGRGLAKAVYALDITDPTSIKLLWERSAGDGKTGSDYIGQMTGKPVIAQTNVDATDTSGDGNWSVLIGNGYNSKNGVAALLQFAINDGTLSVHQTDSSTGNGLAAPAVWINDLTVGISSVAYAGDALGRVWSFGLNTATVNKGKGGTSTTSYAATPTSTGVKLFTATDASTGGNAQPITAGMLVGQDPNSQDLWVFFGTGQYLGSDDLTSMATQSWYGLIVRSSVKGIAADGTNTVTLGNLKQRSIIAETPGTSEVLNADGTVKTAAVAPARAFTATPTTSDMSGKSGWYMKLLSPSSTTASDGTVTYTANQVAEGERMVTPNQFQGNLLVATTRIPTATDICNPSGRGWILAVNPFTGTNPQTSFFDLNGDGQINQPADYIMVAGKPVASGGMGFSSLPNNPIFMGGSMLVSFDNGSATSIKTSGTSNTLQRISWRELINQ